ncbi:MAG: hypothetical protein A4E55_02326 [Pelotomaculum sp. PtaU1.Bin035]|nr:MAG: hypothetical protein A4E55_02326 [Pelotomaculum sp. PtaU1.Bin035]
MAQMVKSRNTILGLFILVLLAVVFPLLTGAPAAAISDEGDPAGVAKTLTPTTTTTAPTAPASKPLTVIMNGAATSSDVPVLQMGSQIYVPVRFLAQSLNYPVEWDGAHSTVYIGMRPLGTDLVEELVPLTGGRIEQPVKIGAIGYPKGYYLEPLPYTDVRWKLDGRYHTVVINMGVPDNSSEDTAEFEITADDDTIAAEILSKDDGLKDFSYNVSGVAELKVSCVSGKGCALISPIAQ